MNHPEVYQFLCDTFDNFGRVTTIEIDNALEKKFKSLCDSGDLNGLVMFKKNHPNQKIKTLDDLVYISRLFLKHKQVYDYLLKHFMDETNEAYYGNLKF